MRRCGMRFGLAGEHSLWRPVAPNGSRGASPNHVRFDRRPYSFFTALLDTLSDKLAFQRKARSTGSPRRNGKSNL